MKDTGCSLCDREAYTCQSKVLKNLLSSLRRNYYSNLVAENLSNMRSLFTIFSKLLHRHSEVNYPQHDTSTSLANDFVVFFGEKIRTIRPDLDQIVVLHSAFDNCTTDCQLRMFTPVSSDELLSIIGSTSPTVSPVI